MKYTAIFASLALAMSIPAFADSEHECQGNSCNGGGTVTNTNVNLNNVDQDVRQTATLTNVNSISNVNKSEGGTGIGVAESSSRSTSGSISGAYAGGSKSSSYSGGNTQSVVVTDSGKMHYSGSYELKNVPNPPDVIANPTAPCRVSVGVAGSGVGFGFGVGSSVLDEGCDAREDSRLLYNMGHQNLALARLCAKPEMAKVIPTCAAAEPTTSTKQIDGTVSLVGN